jgi:hypothetical protein
VRYIHLNPVRAGIVKSLSELDRYKWSGHAVLVGRKRKNWQDRDYILLHFGNKKREAVRRYREFVSDGFSMGKKEELTGGGLRRSVGGWEGVEELMRTKEFQRGDERILGDGDFVNEVLKSAEENLTRKEKLKRQGWDLGRLVSEVCSQLSIDPDDLYKKGRANKLSHAKGLISYLGYYRLGITGAELAKFFGIARSSVSQAVKRGEKFVKENDIKLLS